MCLKKARSSESVSRGSPLGKGAGKSLHEDFHGLSGIDLNRAGTPLFGDRFGARFALGRRGGNLHAPIHTLVRYLGSRTEHAGRFVSLRRKRLD
ncbi:MAG: hypothetical protein CM1200mP36_05060 [Gammaproteobacteria bacterium]|nr:MAG: hypothetical protein CM1200mP36_05060 [Gammaproteobacteria bacterium]